MEMELFSDDSDNEMYEVGVFETDYSTKERRNRLHAKAKNFSKLLEFDFLFRFRLNKTAVSNILTKITSTLKTIPSRNHGVPPLHQLLMTLRFYALGTILLSVADFVGVSTSTASQIITDVSRAIASLYSENIYMLEDTQRGFKAIAGFPKVLGAIDCTHVPIHSAVSIIGEEFRNGKGTFSIKVQAVCNAELLFMNVVARWPGSALSSTIFNNSSLKVQCEEGAFGDRRLIADGAYPCTSYLLTPLPNPVSPAEKRYNDAHIKTRNTIERCFGVWKRRFPVISAKLRLALHTSFNIIIATAVLHNICRKNNIIDVESEIDILQEVADNFYDGPDRQQSTTASQNFITNYFDI